MGAHSEVALKAPRDPGHTRRQVGLVLVLKEVNFQIPFCLLLKGRWGRG